MHDDWLQQVTSPSIPDTPDSPERAEFYTALVHPFWDGVKADVVRCVTAFMTLPGVNRIEIHDEGLRLKLNGDGHGADIRLDVEHERIRAYYSRHPPRGTKRTVLTFTLDMRGDALVVRDCRGCIVDAPDCAKGLLAPLLRRLTTPPKPRKRAPLW
jgi:hypothetical protein